MKLMDAPRSLLAAAGALFSLVPISVLTAGVFSKREWWNLSISHLQSVGWVALALVAPLSWRLIMGRKGSWETLVAICALGCFLLLLSSAIHRNTLQGLWALGVTGVCVFLICWIKREQMRSYFNPQIPWFQGLPRAIPQLRATIIGEGGLVSDPPLLVCRVDEEGLFAFSSQGGAVHQSDVEMELFHGSPFDERKVRIKGRVVRQFESRVCHGQSKDWGIGVRFSWISPDSEKDFLDFLEVLRGEGYISS